MVWRSGGMMTSVNVPFLVASSRTWPGQQPAKGELARHMAHRILIVDDSSLIRSSLRSWLGRNSDWEVCGEAENGQIAVEKVEELRPDIVILDFQMPVMNGLEAAQRISAQAPQTAIVMVTMHASGALLKAALQAGVVDVVPKAEGFPDRLSTVLRNICA